jgi:hypothetical protein
MLLIRSWLIHWLDELEELVCVELPESTEELDVLVLLDAEVEDVTVLDE